MNARQYNALRNFAIAFSVPLMIAVLAALLMGCQTSGVTGTSYPPDIAGMCEAAQNRAIDAYTRFYGKPTRIPEWRVEWADKPIHGGGWTVGAHSWLWRGQGNKEGSLAHEYGHVLLGLLQGSAANTEANVGRMGL